jgi:hypothetical protein
LVQGRPMVHRNNYRNWIKEVSSSGKIEILWPNLDWKKIWVETAFLSTNIREALLLFNQRLLPTKTRCHRLDSTMDQNCQFCQKDPEIDEHLMIHCHLRQPPQGTARRLGWRTNPDEIIRGHIGPKGNLRTIFTLVAAYIFTTWKERSHQRIPRKEEVEKLWVSLCPPVPNQ